MEKKAKNINRVHCLYELFTKRHPSLNESYHFILNEGLKAFGLSLGVLSQINGERNTILAVTPKNRFISPGMVFELKKNHYQLVANERKIISIENVSKNSQFHMHSVYSGIEIGSYISAPIWVSDKLWGTISFSSKQTKEERFSIDDYEFITLIANSIGSLIESNQLITEKENVISELRKNNDILESVFKNSTIGMALVGPSGLWMKVNKSLTNMLGYTEDYLLSIKFQNITHPDDISKDLKQLESLSLGEIPFYQLEKRYLTCSGKYIWILLSVSLVREDSGDVKYFIAQIQNIDEQKKMEEQLKKQKEELHEVNISLERMATEDCLTGLANRRKFMLWFDFEMARIANHPSPVSLAIADVDFFKSYNDDYGHQEGDYALMHIANEFSHTLPKQIKIARFGGEEFIMLFPDTDEKECYLICEILRKRINNLASLKRIVTISIGAVAYYPKERETIHFDDLFKVADAKLYEAKRAGRNQVKVTSLDAYL